MMGSALAPWLTNGSRALPRPGSRLSFGSLRPARGGGGPRVPVVFAFSALLFVGFLDCLVAPWTVDRSLTGQALLLIGPLRA